MPYTDLHDRIKTRAYSLWEQEGRPEGRADEHWGRAEAEVIDADTSEEAGPGTPGGRARPPGVQGHWAPRSRPVQAMRRYGPHHRCSRTLTQQGGRAGRALNTS